MKIINMTTLTADQLEAAALLLHESLPIGWPTLEDAREELRDRLIPQNTYLAAIEDGQVLGFGGLLPQYDGHVFELHPLAVREDQRGKGIGRAIVAALEEEAVKQGGLTLWLGADDEIEGGETSLANTDLYDDLLGKIRDFDPGTHQTAFYLKVGFQVVGVMPDADGPGKPDIYMAKKLR